MFMKKIIVLILLVITLSGCKAEYYCYENDILRGKTCIIQHTTPAQISYDCSNYSRNDFILKGDKCCAQNSNMFCYPAAKKYNCPSGYLDGTNCIIETTYDAPKK